MSGVGFEWLLAMCHPLSESRKRLRSRQFSGLVRRRVRFIRPVEQINRLHTLHYARVKVMALSHAAIVMSQQPRCVAASQLKLRGDRAAHAVELAAPISWQA